MSCGPWCSHDGPSGPARENPAVALELELVLPQAEYKCIQLVDGPFTILWLAVYSALWPFEMPSVTSILIHREQKTPFFDKFLQFLVPLTP